MHIFLNDRTTHTFNEFAVVAFIDRPQSSPKQFFYDVMINCLLFSIAFINGHLSSMENIVMALWSIAYCSLPIWFMTSQSIIAVPKIQS